MNGSQAQFILSRFCRELQRELQPLLVHPFHRNPDYQNPERRKAISEATDKFLTLAMQMRPTASNLWEFTKSDSDRTANHLFARFIVGFYNGVVPLSAWNSFMQNPEILPEKWSQMEAEGFTLRSCLNCLNNELRKYSSYFDNVNLDNPEKNAP